MQLSADDISASHNTHFASQIDKTNRFPKNMFIQIARIHWGNSSE